jgi:hypothetical protein
MQQRQQKRLVLCLDAGKMRETKRKHTIKKLLFTVLVISSKK